MFNYLFKLYLVISHVCIFRKEKKDGKRCSESNITSRRKGRYMRTIITISSLKIDFKWGRISIMQTRL